MSSERPEGVRIAGAASETAASTGDDICEIFTSAIRIETLTDEQKGFMTTIRMLGEEWRSRGVSSLEIRACIAELCPPAMLFSLVILTLPILLKEFRKWLDLMGPNLQQHSSRSNLMTLATNIYSEPEDREVAI